MAQWCERSKRMVKAMCEKVEISKAKHLKGGSSDTATAVDRSINYPGKKPGFSTETREPKLDKLGE